MNPEQNRASAAAEAPTGAELPRVNPESSVERGSIDVAPEQHEKEASHVRTDTVPANLPPVADPTSISADDSQPTNTSTSGPAAARDADTIEKEWVQKIQQVLTQTKGNPYSKEEGIKALKADYMLKRYGRKIGDNN
jgi:hypothetical protein